MDNTHPKLLDRGRLLGRYLAAVLLAALITLSSGCMTVWFPFSTFWYPDACGTGKLLEEGQKEISVGSAYLVPSDIEYAWHLADDWEAQIGVGSTGAYDAHARGWDNLFGAPGLTGANLTVRRRLLGDGPLFLSWTARTTAFMDILDTHTSLMYGGVAASGVSLGYYPVQQFGIFVPLSAAAMIARQGNYQIVGLPGLGLSWEPWRFSLRGFVNYPITMLFQGGGGWQHHNDLSPLPYIGTQIGFRW